MENFVSYNINLSLTKDLRAFLDTQYGEGTFYTSANEYLRDLLREKKLRLEAESFRQGVLEGVQDILDGKCVEYTGDIETMLKIFEEKELHGWHKQ